MANAFEVKGQRDLQRLARRLTAEADGKALRKDLMRNIRAAAKPVVVEMKDNLGTQLPQRGGLAKFMRRSSIGVRTRLQGPNAGVRIVAQKKGHDLASIDRGRVRHPVFGNRKRWANQIVRAGLVSDPVKNSKRDVQRGVLAAMDATAERIARSTRG